MSSPGVSRMCGKKRGVSYSILHLPFRMLCLNALAKTRPGLKNASWVGGIYILTTALSFSGPKAPTRTLRPGSLCSRKTTSISLSVQSDGNRVRSPPRRIPFRLSFRLSFRLPPAPAPPGIVGRCPRRSGHPRQRSWGGCCDDTTAGRSCARAPGGRGTTDRSVGIPARGWTEGSSRWMSRARSCRIDREGPGSVAALPPRSRGWRSGPDVQPGRRGSGSARYVAACPAWRSGEDRVRRCRAQTAVRFDGARPMHPRCTVGGARRRHSARWPVAVVFCRGTSRRIGATRCGNWAGNWPGWCSGDLNSGGWIPCVWTWPTLRCSVLGRFADAMICRSVSAEEDRLVMIRPRGGLRGRLGRSSTPLGMANPETHRPHCIPGSRSPHVHYVAWIPPQHVDPPWLQLLDVFDCLHPKPKVRSSRSWCGMRGCSSFPSKSESTIDSLCTSRVDLGMRVFLVWRAHGDEETGNDPMQAGCLERFATDPCYEDVRQVFLMWRRTAIYWAIRTKRCWLNDVTVKCPNNEYSNITIDWWHGAVEQT